MIFSENRSLLFGIMRCRHTPGGADAKDNTKVIKPEPGTIGGAAVVNRGGRLPFPGNICPFYG
jgi:hypothetical protein